MKIRVNGKYIEEFKSASEAARIFNFSFSNIARACRKKIKRYGSKWMYKEDYIQLMTTQKSEIYIDKYI